MINKSKFVVQPYRRKYLAGYAARMSKDNNSALWDDNVASVLIDQGFHIEESPRSIYSVEKLYDALAKYSPDRAPYVTFNSDVKAGISLAYTCFANSLDHTLELSAFTPKLVHEITSNHKGSAGLTAWGQTKAESEYRAYERGIQQIKGEKKPEPCVAFKRTQFEGKTRLVWGYPYAMTALEGIFARPLIERFKCGNTPMAFGMSTGTMGAKLRVSSYHKRFAYSVDVSSFDASANAELICIAFRILRTWFDLEQIEPTTQTRYKDIFDQCEHYFIHTPIVMPDLNVYYGKKHGVPSGSYFTQMIDSIINVIYVGAIANHFNLFLDKDDIFVLGDDVLFWSNRDISLEKLTDYGTKIFQIKFNADKSSKFTQSEPIHYLGRDWINGIPTLPVRDILIRMTQPETFRKYPKGKREKERQVMLLLMSYAAVYKDAYPIYLKAFGNKVRWYTTNTSLENYIKGMGETDVSDYSLSGLQRYIAKYITGTSWKGITPLGLQFWK